MGIQKWSYFWRIYYCILETENSKKKIDISSRKSNITESPKVVLKRLKTQYLRSYEQFLVKRIYYSIFETKSLSKKCDIRLKKSKNTESPKMVCKLLKIHYLRSYEQFLENRTW